MKYFSTRGGNERLSFEDAVLTGLAPNGGLYIPETIPSLPQDWQTKWSNYSFQELSHAVLSLFISPTEISPSDLQSLIEKSYQSFRSEEVTPTIKLTKDDGKDLFVLELWHGPTFAFKDVALQLLGNLFEFFLKRRNEKLRQEKEAKGEKLSETEKHKLTVLGATSGDTGSAAIYGLRNKENISIFILHPKGRVSPIQEAQMTTVLDSNVHNVAVKATFDDCQDIVKALFSDKEFNNTHKLGAINSINWARILAQTVYYFLSYFSVQRQLSASSSSPREIQFVVPTGNFGDVLAGYYAKRMGLPITKLGIGTNENDILARFWRSGRYEKVGEQSQGENNATNPVLGSSDGKQATTSAGGVKETLSPAMDILVSSNFERLLWYLAYEDAAGSDNQRREEAGSTLDRWMSAVKSDGRVVLPTSVLELARKDFVAERVSDEETIETIQKYFSSKSNPYVVDPHTAVGLAAAEKIASNAGISDTTTQIVLSTAHPAKFSEAVSRALKNESNFDFEGEVLPGEFKGLLDCPRRVIEVEKPETELVKRVIDRVAEEARTIPSTSAINASI
ncbi:threonine synthase [Tulasnella sp. 419]|nr:threonine synthase [Tulasnella sp. 419]